MRVLLLAKQKGRCAICNLPIKSSEIPVLDHNHETGAVRGVLHHSCNAVLGKIENSYKRFGLGNHLMAFLNGVAAYLQAHATNITGFLHPTHYTEDEKRLKANAKARKKYALKKKAAAA
ncbi:DNA exonuclease VII [Caulobacter phage Quill_5.2]|uniref:DNA exonuclease VII n=1 Tax=Caulobacter phage Quill_5.2 TaxID=3075108 RepID=A0AA96Q4E0_9CAUD|nr:DNA exonuclease VII [Caulobacter phage Quill_5.2]